MSADKKKIERTPEDSIEFRSGIYVLCVLAITASCLFVKTPIPFTVLFIWAVTTGSYVSYRYREQKNSWVTWIVIPGTLLVTGNCLYEILNIYIYGPLAWLVPIVHQLAGMLALHSFEMKSRYELNIAALLSLLLLSVCAPVARGIDFGACVLAYISVGALVLYFDNRSLTLRTAPADLPTIAGGSENLLRQFESPGKPSLSKDALAAFCLPLASIVVFMFVPRNDFLFDWLSTEVKRYTEKLNLTDLLKLSPPGGEDLKQNLRGVYLPIRPKLLPPEKQPENKKAPPKSKAPKPKSEKAPEKKKEKPPAEKNKKPNPPHQPTKKPNQPPQHKAPPPPGESKEGKEGKEGKQATDKSKKAKAPPQKSPEKKPPEKPKQENPAAAEKLKEKKSEPKPKEMLVDKPGSKSKLDTRQPMPDSNDLMFRVSGNRTMYSRQDCFDYFDGEIWSTSDQETKKTFIKPEKGLYDFSKCDLLETEKGFPAVDVILQYSVESDLGTLMPAGGLVQKLDYPGDSLTVDVYRRLITQQPLTKGIKYKVFAQLAVYDQKKMRADHLLDSESEQKILDDLADYLQLPKDEDKQVSELAHKLTDNQGNWFRKCELITHYLRKNYYDDKGKTASTEDTNTVDDFLLKTRKGDCKDFASAFVILARMAGIPARCVSGYAPGTANTVTGQNEVRLSDAHIWGEAYIPGYDWVPFDATPTGYLPDRPPENNYSISSLQKKLKQDNPWNEEKRTLRAFWRHIRPYIPYIVAGVVLLALLIGGLIVGIRRYLRWQKERAGHPSRRIYLEVMNSLKRAKLVKLPSETSTEFVQRLKAQMNQPPGKGITIDDSLTKLLTKFLDTYAAVYFGDEPKMSDLQELGTALKAELKSR
jgi:transglutaminase-like putative cysteine protease